MRLAVVLGCATIAGCAPTYTCRPTPREERTVCIAMTEGYAELYAANACAAQPGVFSHEPCPEGRMCHATLRTVVLRSASVMVMSGYSRATCREFADTCRQLGAAGTTTCTYAAD